jgi:hypothetical protein
MDAQVEHGYYLAEREHNVSQALQVLQQALGMRPQHCPTLVALAHLLLRRNLSLFDTDDDDAQQVCADADTNTSSAGHAGKAGDRNQALGLGRHSRHSSPDTALPATPPVDAVSSRTKRRREESAVGGAGGLRSGDGGGEGGSAGAGSKGTAGIVSGRNQVSQDVMRAGEIAGVVMRLEPKVPASLCVHAAVLEAKGEMGRAKDVYNKAVALDPHRWETTLAFAHFQTRAYPQNLVASERVPSVCAIDCLWVCVLLCVCVCVRACMHACVCVCVQK